MDGRAVLVLRCTQVLLRALPKQIPVHDQALDDAVLGSWFADLFRHGRRRCLLITNSSTLYSVFLPAVPRGALHDLPGLSRLALTAAISTEPFAAHACRLLEERLRDSVIAKTNSRRVLGSMIDLRYEALAFLAGRPEITAYQARSLSGTLNRVPMSYLKGGCAVDSMGALVSDVDM
jgi:hypothetical protein